MPFVRPAKPDICEQQDQPTSLDIQEMLTSVGFFWDVTLNGVQDVLFGFNAWRSVAELGDSSDSDGRKIWKTLEASKLCFPKLCFRLQAQAGLWSFRLRAEENSEKSCGGSRGSVWSFQLNFFVEEWHLLWGSKVERIKVVPIAVLFYWHVACSFNFADAFSAFSSYLRYLLLLVLVQELTMWPTCLFGTSHGGGWGEGVLKHMKKTWSKM